MSINLEEIYEELPYEAKAEFMAHVLRALMWRRWRHEKPNDPRAGGEHHEILQLAALLERNGYPCPTYEVYNKPP